MIQKLSEVKWGGGLTDKQTKTENKSRKTCRSPEEKKGRKADISERSPATDGERGRVVSGEADGCMGGTPEDERDERSLAKQKKNTRQEKPISRDSSTDGGST